MNIIKKAPITFKDVVTRHTHEHAGLRIEVTYFQTPKFNLEEKHLFHIKAVWEEGDKGGHVIIDTSTKSAWDAFAFLYHALYGHDRHGLYQSSDAFRAMVKEIQTKTNSLGITPEEANLYFGYSSTKASPDPVLEDATEPVVQFNMELPLLRRPVVKDERPSVSVASEKNSFSRSKP